MILGLLGLQLGRSLECIFERAFGISVFSMGKNNDTYIYLYINYASQRGRGACLPGARGII